MTARRRQVLHVTPYMHAAAGGPPVVVGRLAEGAAACGWEASVVTTSLFCEDDGRELQAALSRSMQARVLSSNRSRFLGLSGDAERHIAGAVREADIVHVHTLWNPLNTSVRRACERARRPYVLMPHGMLDPWSLRVGSVRKRVYMWLRERENLAGAKRIVFTAPLEEQLARSRLPWLPRGAVVPLGADAPPAVARVHLAKAFYDRLPGLTDRRVLLFLGRLHPKKGIERALPALRVVVERYPEAVLVVAGTGEPSYVASLAAAVGQAGLSSHVVFTGLLSGDAKWGALAAAELFLLPSHQENFAIAVAEAMHAALPVIITDAVNIWPLVEAAAAGVVLRGAAVEVALGEAIARLLEAPGEAAAMGERGRLAAAREFTWEAAAQRTYRLYETVLAEDPSCATRPASAGA